jgi:hypothetical protein
MTWKLRRVRQCEKCPWKISTDPRDIPNGYSEEQHRRLARTIATPGAMHHTAAAAMACHEHKPGEEAHCVGWLMNQIGAGNNIPLRMAMRDCENIGQVQLDGPQHEHFEDTLPDPDLDQD